MNPWELLGKSVNPQSNDYGNYLNQLAGLSPELKLINAQSTALNNVQPYRAPQAMEDVPVEVPGTVGRNPMDLLSNAPDAETLKWREKLKTLMADQEGGVSSQNELARKYSAQPRQLDLSPLAALTDSLTGSKLLAGYKRPQSEQENIVGTSGIAKTGQEERQKLIDNLTKLSQGHENNKLLGQLYGKESTQQLSAQKQATQASKDVTNRLEGASRIHDLWKKADTGEIKSNAAFKDLITSEIQRLETGASNPAYAQAEQRAMHTAAEKLGELTQYISGDPNASVSPGVLKQLRSLSKELTSTYMSNADSVFDMLDAGALPSQTAIYQQKRKALHKTYGDRFGGWKAESETAGSISGKDKQAVDWANANPNDPRAAAIKQKLGM